jgi:dTDP-glucose 4,6-dehydratase
MAKETVLITGGAGFIGSNLTTFLLDKGYKVIVLDDLSRSTTENIRACYNHSPNFYFFKGSVMDFNLVDRLIDNADMVFHLAAQVHWEESIDDPVASFDVHTKGTQNVLEAIRRSMVKRDPVKLMLYSSSSEVYGTGQYMPMDEKHPFNPQSPYAAGKAAADRLCSAYHHVYNLPIIILRQFNTYGPNQRMKGYSAVIPKFVSQVVDNSPPTVYGSGKQTKDFHYIDDLINAYSLIINKWEDLDLFGKAINFGTGKETSVNDLARIIIDTVGEETGHDLKDTLRPIHLPKRPGEVMRFAADITLAKKELKFLPRIGIEEGIRKYVRWYMKGAACSQ